MVNRPKFFSRYWIITIFVIIQLLTGYVYLPLYGESAQPTPTPEIATVPPLPTATPTTLPFPIITATSSPTSVESAPQPTLTPAPKSTSTETNNTERNKTNSGQTDNTTVKPNLDINTSQATQPTSPGSITNSVSITEPVVGVTGTVLANNLELREEPNTQSLVIDKLANGAIVQILRRSIDQSWLYVCCGSATKKQGWAKLEFIQINPRPVKLKPVPSAATSTATQQVTVTDGALTLAIQPTPTFVWQGQNLTLRFLIKNPSKRTLNNIRLRDDLPPELRFVTANVDHQGSLQQEGGPDGAIFTLFWPTLAAGAEVTAAVTVQIAPNTPNGALIKNLAVVNSQEVGNVVGGVSIVMPPVALPKF